MKMTQSKHCDIRQIKKLLLVSFFQKKEKRMMSVRRKPSTRYAYILRSAVHAPARYLCVLLIGCLTSGCGSLATEEKVDPAFTTFTGSIINIVTSSQPKSVGARVERINFDTSGNPLLSTNLDGVVGTSFAAKNSDGLSNALELIPGGGVPGGVFVDGNRYTAAFFPELAAYGSTTSNIVFGAAWAGLSYSDFGLWESFESSTSRVVGYFHIGLDTPVASMPVSGAATYNGKMVGGLIETTGQLAIIKGDASLTATFTGLQGITGQISNIVTPTGNLGVSVGLDGTTTLNSFAGTATPTVANVAVGTGNFSGTYYGPAAEELGGSFRTNLNDGRKMLGSFGAKR